MSDTTEGQIVKKKSPQVLVLALPNMLIQIRGTIPVCTMQSEIKSLCKPQVLQNILVTKKNLLTK